MASDIMRLLNAKTKKLEEFFEKNIPRYAILSHTWGEDEVLFKDITKGRYNNDSEKIEGCCRKALDNSLDYVWIDTCCIDKRSSAELTEAINSMFDWYKNAAVCYAYLADVHNSMDLSAPESTLAFRKSKWWTRGWTLQELLAPRLVEFYSASWTYLGEKLQHEGLSSPGDSPTVGSINDLITEITGIRTTYLYDYTNAYWASIAEKMSWAALRETTRVEDVAYSLLGIFNVNMPLLYGEKEKAFLRLQKAIISASDDQSIFAWRSTQVKGLFYLNQFARSPSEFQECADLVLYTPDWAGISHYSMTNAGLQISMRLRKIPGSNGAFIGLLDCAWRNSQDSQNIAITLIPLLGKSAKANMAGPFIRYGTYPVSIPLSLFQEPDNDPAIPIYIRSRYVMIKESGLMFTTSFGLGRSFIEVFEVYPPGWELIVDKGLFSDFSGFMGSDYSNFETLRLQIIYLHCLMGTGESFVVRLNYRFRALRFRIYPSTLEFSLAYFKRGLSLVEAMIVHEGQMDMVLNWQQQLELNDGILTLRIEEEEQGSAPQPRWILHTELIRTRAIQVENGEQVLPNKKR